VLKQRIAHLENVASTHDMKVSSSFFFFSYRYISYRCLLFFLFFVPVSFFLSFFVPVSFFLSFFRTGVFFFFFFRTGIFLSGIFLSFFLSYRYLSFLPVSFFLSYRYLFSFFLAKTKDLLQQLSVETLHLLNSFQPFFPLTLALTLTLKP
jgi:hypothetical protein